MRLHPTIIKKSQMRKKSDVNNDKDGIFKNDINHEIK